MTFKQTMTVVSLFASFFISVSPIPAFSQDSCDPRLEGWTLDYESCGPLIILDSHLPYIVVSHNVVDVKARAVRVDFHMRVAAPYGFSDVSFKCGDYIGQTEFGLEIRGGSLSAIRSFARADGSALSFPLQVSEAQFAGSRKSFEISGNFSMPRGTKSFSGGCSLSIMGPITFDNRASDGEQGYWSFTVEGSESGNNASDFGNRDTEVVQFPKLTGRSIVGEVLTATRGQWAGPKRPKVNYQWVSCNKKVKSPIQKWPKSCRKIQGAQGKKFTLTTKQQGRFVAVLVTITSDDASSVRWLTRSTARVR